MYVNDCIYQRIPNWIIFYLQGYNDAVNEAYGVASDAFFFGDMTGRMYQDWYGIQALSKKAILRVHWGV